MNPLWIAVNLVYPTNPLTYIRIYFNAVERLQKPENSLHIRFLVHLLSLNLILKILHLSLYLGLTPDLDLLTRALHFDGIMLIISLAFTNVSAGICGLMAFYYNGILFFGGRELLKLNGLLRRVLSLEDSKGDEEGDRDDNFLKTFLASKYLGMSSSDLVRKVFSAFFKVFQSFSLVTVLFLLPYSHVKFAYIFAENKDYFRAQSTLKLFTFGATYLLSSTSYLIGFCNFSHVLSITFSCSFSLLLIFYIKLRQSGAILKEMLTFKNKKKRKTRFFRVRFAKYRREFTAALIFFFRVNRFYGRLFLACFSAICPVNVIINVGLVKGLQVAPFFLIFFNLHQFLFVFVIHYLLTRCTAHIHRTKELYQLVAKRGNSGYSLRTRISMAAHLWAFHCWEGCGRYGCSYGSIGLISVATFARFLMLYGKQLMMTSKMLSRVE